MPEIQKKSKGCKYATAGGICAILFWSLTVAFTRRVSEQLGPVSGAAFVHVVASVLGIFRIISSKNKRQAVFHQPPLYLIVCGFLFLCYLLFFFLAIGTATDNNQVLEVGLINYLWPTMTLVLSVFILGNKPNWMLVPGTLLALSGIFLVLTSGAPVSLNSLVGNLMVNPGPYLMILVSAFSWALYSAFTRKWAGGKSGGAITIFMLAAAGTLLLISFFIDEPRTWSIRVLMEVLAFGVTIFLAYTLWDNAMRNGNVVLVSAGSYLIPLFSTIVSGIMLSVVPTPRLWFGCGVLIAGSMLSWISFSRKKLQNNK